MFHLIFRNMSENTYFDWGHSFNFLRLTGLAPFKKTKQGKYLVSQKLKLYSFILFLIALLNFPANYQMLIKSDVEKENFLSIAFILFDISGYTIASIFSILITHYKSSVMCNLINKIIKTKENLNKMSKLKIKNYFLFGAYFSFAIENVLFVAYSIIAAISLVIISRFVLF